MQRDWLVVVGLAGLHPKIVAMKRQQFSESRCNAHLHAFLRPCLITAKWAHNKYSPSCLLYVCVCMCLWVGADWLNRELCRVSERKPFSSLSVYPQVHTHFQLTVAKF